MAIALFVIIIIAFIICVFYLIYLKVNHRSIDEDDCAISKKNGIQIRLKEIKKKERKQALKKKRELEKLDKRQSKKNLYK